MKRYFSELLGTYLMVFFGTGAMVINDLQGGVITHVGIALAFGVGVMAVIYALGEISGAHINPAVTIAFWLAGKFSGKEVLPYIIAQTAGAILASLTLTGLFPTHEYLGGTLPANSITQAFVLEYIMTFFLMFVIILVSTGSKEVGPIAGLVIGGVVFLEALVGGPLTGASMNPARSIGPALVSGHTESLWLYIVAPILGATTAIFTCVGIKDQECCPGAGNVFCRKNSF